MAVCKIGARKIAMMAPALQFNRDAPLRMYFRRRGVESDGGIGAVGGRNRIASHQTLARLRGRSVWLKATFDVLYAYAYKSSGYLRTSISLSFRVGFFR